MTVQKERVKDRPPLTVRITQVFFMAVAMIWLTFSFFVALGGHPSYSQMGAFRWIMAGVTFVAGAVLVLLRALLLARYRPAWYFSVCMLAAMTLAGFFDDVGWIDILVMLSSALPCALLIKDRKWYLAKTPINRGS